MRILTLKKLIFLFFILYYSSSFAEPPSEVPDELYDQFTLNEKIPVIYSYRDDTYSSDQPKVYLKKDIDESIELIRSGHVGYYGRTDQWLYEALEKHPIQGKEVVIIGSATSWYESIVIAYGGHPTTIEYNKIITDDPRLTVMTPDEYEKNPKKFDIILSISSIEHDGLGRYGDPINPNGDLEFMAIAKNELLTESGHMILAVPIGQDALTWNLHRIYGRIRFPLLIKEWNLIQEFGFNVSEFDGEFGCCSYQPIFYLVPKK